MFFNHNIYGLKIFNWFNKEIVDQIVNSCEIREYQRWEIIVVEWQESNWEWYIIKTWKVAISIKWQRIAELNEWDIFWEIALLNEEVRTATVKAEAKLEVIVLSMDWLIEIINNDENALNKTILRRIEENIEREE